MRLVMIPMTWARRAPTRLARAGPIAPIACPSRSVTRPWRRVSTGTCSTNVRRTRSRAACCRARSWPRSARTCEWEARSKATAASLADAGQGQVGGEPGTGIEDGFAVLVAVVRQRDLVSEQIAGGRDATADQQATGSEPVEELLLAAGSGHRLAYGFPQFLVSGAIPLWTGHMQ